MIRLTYLLRRRSNLSRAEFQRYWLNEHGPLVSSVARKLNVLRYVQVHTIDDPANEAMVAARGGMEPNYDGVAELYFDSREALLTALQSDAGADAAAALLEDEARFIDLPRSPLWLGHEYPQVNPTPENLVATPRSGLVKLYFPLRALSALGEAEAQRYWYQSHGPLIRRQAAGSGILRYLQVHRAGDPIEAQLREARGTQADAYTGHAELWLEWSQFGISSPGRVAAARRAVEDEERFIDFKRSSMWLAHERVLVDLR